ncbi:FRG domain-containing protein [Paenisporosarcina quisquiliarum]|uniref:FRG domain-containing protein n=1 Tax=Paenisporosarcina quisquiliarum TaxID=365346 RepID=UPI003736C5F0
MLKYIYYSNRVRKNKSKIEKLISEENEAIVWFIHTRDLNNIKVEVIYYNNKNGSLNVFNLLNDTIDIELSIIQSFASDTYIQVVDNAFKDICVIKINNLLQFIKITDILNETSEYVFRGQKNKDWALIASIFRKNYNHNKEYNIFKEIKKNRFNEFISDNFLDNLIHMQHYGIPTRLLDWSKNPLIPLFFACSDNSKIGRVSAYKPSIIYEFDGEQYNSISNYFKEDFNKSQLSAESIKLLVSIFRNSLPQSIFLETSNENDRLKAQRGLFSILIDIRPQYIDVIREEVLKSSNMHTNFVESKIDMNIYKKIARFKLEEMKEFFTDNKNLNINKHFDFDIFLSELNNNNFWREEDHSYETNLIDHSVEFIISSKYKSLILSQLERLNINSMTVYPDSFGFIQYINDKYERME